VSAFGAVRANLTAAAELTVERLSRSPHHVLLSLLLHAAVLLGLGHLLPGVLVEDFVAALLATIVIALLNALVRPILIVLTLPLTVASFGLVSLVINASMVVVAAPLVPGLEVTGFLPAFSLAIVLTVATTIVNVVLSVDEDETFYAQLARRIQQAGVADGDRSRPGLVIIQIDGLAAPILRNAIRVGLVPRMASWVRSGRYRLVEWDCPPPSQTSASQAGILHGNNEGIPAFRWYEKASGRLLVSNRPADAAEIEARISDGQGLLHPAGASVGNLFSGDAADAAFTMSRMTDPVGSIRADAFQLYFVDPAAFIRTIVLSIGEMVKELVEARRQRRQDVQPRVHRGATFAFLRAATNVVLRDLNTTFVVRSMNLGVPVVYVDYVDYDEIAHHAGPERLESLRTLAGVDRAIASLERAGASAARDYRFVLLSDHGQSQGATFRQRFGQTLEELLSDLTGRGTTVVAATGRTEAYGPVNALLTELIQRPGVAGRVSSRALRGQTSGGAVQLEGDEQTVEVPGSDGPTELVVCASGNLANVYFPAHPGRLSAEEIEELHPGLLASLSAHPGIGFVMVRSEQHGTLILGAGGVRRLGDDHVDGDDPLADLGGHAAAHLRRLDAFVNVGDLLLNSTYDPDLGEVAAFEELVGSHGGLGGPQNQPFLMAPAELPLPDGALVGAPAVHGQLRRWIDGLGIPEDAKDPPRLEPVREPRGLGVLVAYMAINSLVLLLAGLGILAMVTFGSPAEVPDEIGRLPAFVGFILGGFGVIGLLTALGLWLRQRWARYATLALQAIAVLQVVFALASDGLRGVLSYGVIAAAVALVLFFYLTRPHVAAVFERPDSTRPLRQRGRPTGDPSG
jgi:uncharacterized membrane protein YvlD (DUF360 family)